MRTLVFCGSILVLCTALREPAHAQATNARAIYRCEVAGVLTFSDRPCQTGAEPYELDAKALNTFEPPPRSASPRTAAGRTVKTRQSAAGPDAAKRKEQCERWAQGLRELRARQRSGYTAREGARLEEREAKLKSQLREARCG